MAPNSDLLAPGTYPAGSFSPGRGERRFSASELGWRSFTKPKVLIPGSGFCFPEIRGRSAPNENPFSSHAKLYSKEGVSIKVEEGIERLNELSLIGTYLCLHLREHCLEGK